MNCHECAAKGSDTPAFGVCRHCFVGGLCKDHIVASYRTGIFPQYSCAHRPQDAFVKVARPAIRPFTPARAA
jgi:hypothetical protein